MQSSFRSFGLGLVAGDLAGLSDPGGAIFFVYRPLPDRAGGSDRLDRRDPDAVLTGTTLNIQSLMGMVMLQGMVVSNSILIVDFANVLRGEGRSVRDAVAHACRIRLRPILMTSLATVVGLLPMAFKLETGSEAYAPLARVIIGGLLFFDCSDDFRRSRGVPADLPKTRGDWQFAGGHRGDKGMTWNQTIFKCFIFSFLLKYPPDPGGKP